MAFLGSVYDGSGHFIGIENLATTKSSDCFVISDGMEHLDFGLDSGIDPGRSFEIYNSLGQRIHSEWNPEGRLTVPLLAGGMYQLLHSYIKGNQSVVRLLKQ